LFLKTLFTEAFKLTNNFFFIHQFIDIVEKTFGVSMINILGAPKASPLLKSFFKSKALGRVNQGDPTLHITVRNLKRRP